MGGQSRQGFQDIGAEETLCPTAGRGSSGADFEDGEAPRGHHQRKRGATWSPGRLFLRGVYSKMTTLIGKIGKNHVFPEVLKILRPEIVWAVFVQQKRGHRRRGTLCGWKRRIQMSCLELL